MSSPVEHTDVGAYALGLLENEDRIAFEAHLATCARCRSELDEMGDLGSLFAEVEIEAFVPAPHEAGVRHLPVRPFPVTGLEAERPAVPSRVVDLAARRATGARRAGAAFAVAAAAAALVLIGVGIGGRGDDGSSEARVEPTQTVTQPGPVGARHPAQGLVRGIGDVTGAVVVESKGWGSRVILELAGVQGPLRCSLIVVGKDRSQEVVGNWAVPGKGYGVSTNPTPLVFEGGTSIAGNAIDRLEVRTSDGKTLITVPM